MVGDIWGMDGSNLVLVRAAKAVSIGPSIGDNRGSTSDSDRHREA
jgi:hypothetical protein